MKPGNGKSCPVCGSELKPLFSSFFCPACEQAKKAAPDWLTVEAAVDEIKRRLPHHCKFATDDGMDYVRWPKHDRVTISVFESTGGWGQINHLIYMAGNGCPRGYIDGWLYFLGERK